MNQLPRSAYGLLLTFDGYQANPRICSDVGGLYSFLYQLPGRIGMRRLGYPQIVRVDEPGIRGLSGFTFIMESHISIHTYAEQRFVTADVYSCRTFETEKVVAHLASYFQTSFAGTSIIVRGTSFQPPRQRKRPRR